MLRDDTVRQRQAYAVTGSLGGEEGNENFLSFGRANSRSRIADTHNGRALTVERFRRDSGEDLPIGTAVRNGFGRIAQQIQDCLSQHARISVDIRHIRIRFDG